MRKKGAQILLTVILGVVIDEEISRQNVLFYSSKYPWNVINNWES